MAIKKSIGKKAVPLDSKTADKLLKLLSTDNEFRRLFKRDPQAALLKIGHSGGEMATCCPVEAIAPKREFAASAEALKAQFVSAGIFTRPHCFEAGKVASTLRRK